MGKKHKHPEHVNLERYLISYADFITLLFATFVVLYALSQVDVKDFKALEESLKKAFSSPSIMQGSEGVMSQSSSLFEGNQADSIITPLMMEYVSQKYEKQAMEEIEETIKEKVKSGDLEGVEVMMTDTGILIRLKGDYFFKPGSAELLPNARRNLDKIGAIIAKKFVLHNMRIEGHTDNQPMSSQMYPSNWELSSARSGSIIRYLIKRFKFMPSLFTDIGFADTRPIANNSYTEGRSKNRRVEILILRNKFNSSENPQNEIMKMSKQEQEDMQANRLSTINKIEALERATQVANKENEKQSLQDAKVLNAVYQKEVKRLSHQTNALDNNVRMKITGQGDWLKPPAQAPKRINIKDIKVFQ